MQLVKQVSKCSFISSCYSAFNLYLSFAFDQFDVSDLWSRVNHFYFNSSYCNATLFVGDYCFTRGYSSYFASWIYRSNFSVAGSKAKTTFCFLSSSYFYISNIFFDGEINCLCFWVDVQFQIIFRRSWNQFVVVWFLTININYLDRYSTNYYIVFILDYKRIVTLCFESQVCYFQHISRAVHSQFRVGKVNDVCFVATCGDSPISDVSFFTHLNIVLIQERQVKRSFCFQNFRRCFRYFCCNSRIFYFEGKRSRFFADSNSDCSGTSFQGVDFTCAAYQSNCWVAGSVSYASYSNIFTIYFFITSVFIDFNTSIVFTFCDDNFWFLVNCYVSQIPQFAVHFELYFCWFNDNSVIANFYSYKSRLEFFGVFRYNNFIFEGVTVNKTIFQFASLASNGTTFKHFRCCLEFNFVTSSNQRFNIYSFTVIDSQAQELRCFKGSASNCIGNSTNLYKYL